MKLRDMNSGYIGNAERMRNFLECWRSEIGVKEAKKWPEFEVEAAAPQSLKDFFAARRAIGFVSTYEKEFKRKARFIYNLPKFRDHSKKDYKIWEDVYRGYPVPDEKYYVYDKSQGPFRWTDLEAMRVVGEEVDGVFYLLNMNEVSKDGEVEAMFLHHASGRGGVRFKSFAHLVVTLYLEERERAAGRDASFGHLYYFRGDLKQTCASLILDL